jgi:hypothetical protein
MSLLLTKAGPAAPGVGAFSPSDLTGYQFSYRFPGNNAWVERLTQTTPATPTSLVGSFEVTNNGIAVADADNRRCTLTDHGSGLYSILSPGFAAYLMADPVVLAGDFCLWCHARSTTANTATAPIVGANVADATFIGWFGDGNFYVGTDSEGALPKANTFSAGANLVRVRRFNDEVFVRFGAAAEGVKLGDRTGVVTIEKIGAREQQNMTEANRGYHALIVTSNGSPSAEEDANAVVWIS